MGGFPLKSAHMPYPLLQLHPEENGWHLYGDVYEFNWFDGGQNPPINADMPVLDEDDIADENITLLYQSESDEEDFDD